MAEIQRTRVIAYCCASPEESLIGDMDGIAVQRARLQSCATASGNEIEAYFIDAYEMHGAEGHRVEFDRLWAYCRQHPQPARKPGLVLVESESRWGRWRIPEESISLCFELLRDTGWRVSFLRGISTGETGMNAAFDILVDRHVHAARTEALRWAAERADLAVGMRTSPRPRTVEEFIALGIAELEQR